MPVSGIVITCVSGSSDVVATRLSGLDGVEVHGVLPDGQVIAVVEADTVQGEVDLVSHLHEIDGVVAVRLAYHNFEDESEPEPGSAVHS
jgi:periplasmic nitrate reductase NapD